MILRESRHIDDVVDASDVCVSIGSAFNLDWTAISPPASIQPGQRTGKFRLGRDHLIKDDKGESRISREDFAIAIVDDKDPTTLPAAVPDYVGGLASGVFGARE